MRFQRHPWEAADPAPITPEQQADNDRELAQGYASELDDHPVIEMWLERFGVRTIPELKKLLQKNQENELAGYDQARAVMEAGMPEDDRWFEPESERVEDTTEFTEADGDTELVDAV